MRKLLPAALMGILATTLMSTAVLGANLGKSIDEMGVDVKRMNRPDVLVVGEIHIDKTKEAVTAHYSKLRNAGYTAIAFELHPSMLEEIKRTYHDPQAFFEMAAQYINGVSALKNKGLHKEAFDESEKNRLLYLTADKMGFDTLAIDTGAGVGFMELAQEKIGYRNEQMTQAIAKAVSKGERVFAMVGMKHTGLNGPEKEDDGVEQLLRERGIAAASLDMVWDQEFISSNAALNHPQANSIADACDALVKDVKNNGRYADQIAKIKDINEFENVLKKSSKVPMDVSVVTKGLKKSMTAEGYTWMNKKGNLESPGLQPAVVEDNLTAWYKDGKLHRGNDLPAEIAEEVDGTVVQTWYKDGKIFREGDQPNRILMSPSSYIQQWVVDGKIVKQTTYDVQKGQHKPVSIDI